MSTEINYSLDDILALSYRYLNKVGLDDTPSPGQKAHGTKVINQLLKALDAANWMRWLYVTDPKYIWTSDGTRSYDLHTDVRLVTKAQIADVEAESLATGGAFNANWSEEGDWTIDATDASYAYSTGATSELTQANASMAVAAIDSKWYALKYTVSGVTGSPAAAIKAGLAKVQTALSIVNGTHTVVFRTGASASSADFVIEITTGVSGDAFNLDDLSLREIDGGSKNLSLIPPEDYAELADPYEVGKPQKLLLSQDKETRKVVPAPCPAGTYLITYWYRRKVHILVDADATYDYLDLPEEWTRFVALQTAVDLAASSGAPMDIWTTLGTMAKNAFDLAVLGQADTSNAEAYSQVTGTAQGG